MSRNRYIAGVVAVGMAAGAVAQSRAAAFVENFNDGNAASRWTVASQQEATRDPSTGPDGSVNFAFDYSSLGVASPAGSSDTIGAFVQVNNTDQAGDEGETYVIFPTSYALPASGDWRVDADMYVWNDGQSGTTELGMVGAYINPASPVAPYQYGSDGGPLAWVYCGEGGAAADLASFKDGGPGSTGYAGIADYNDVPAGMIPGFQTGTDGGSGPAGTDPSGSWVKVSIEKSGNMINWFLNGALIDSYDNSGGTYGTGTFFLGTTDPFNSSNAGGGAIIDNVVVSVPEPASLSLLGAVGLLAGRRRRRA
jgi:hypothetical protein